MYLYTTVHHNVKAIYQSYSGRFDGKPARFWDHSPVKGAKRHVKLAAGITQIISRPATSARRPEVLNHAAFADRENSDAHALLANVYEQMRNGLDSGSWRNVFNSGTTELRNGDLGTPTPTHPIM